MFHTKVVEKLETHILCSILFFSEYNAICEIMWKDIAERSRPQTTIWRMRFACWIPKATNTHSDCVIHISFPRQRWSHERASVLLYTYMVCLFTLCIRNAESKVYHHPFLQLVPLWIPFSYDCARDTRIDPKSSLQLSNQRQGTSGAKRYLQNEGLKIDKAVCHT